MLQEEKLDEETRIYCKQVFTKVEDWLTPMMGSVQMSIGNSFGKSYGYGTVLIPLSYYSETLNHYLHKLLKESLN